MHRSTWIAILTLAATWPAVATAQTPPSQLRNPNVVVDYVEPRPPNDPKARDYAKDLAKYRSQKKIYDRLKQRQVLEELSAFLSPLKLPRTLRIRTKACNEVNAFYDPDEWSVNICYEWIEASEAMAPKGMSPEGYTRQEVIVGSFVGVVLHELGHAVNDMLNLPVLGREEDAADQIAAFIMTQFGKDVARTAIKGTAYVWLTFSRTGQPAYWDVHSTSGQRFYNFLCIGYGGDPEAFKEFVGKLLPKERLETCPHEFRQVHNAFVKTVLPHVDQELLKKVQATQWLRPDDGTWD
jgi:Putative metallopeptidase